MGNIGIPRRLPDEAGPTRRAGGVGPARARRRPPISRPAQPETYSVQRDRRQGEKKIEKRNQKLQGRPAYQTTLQARHHPQHSERVGATAKTDTQQQVAASTRPLPHASTAWRRHLLLPRLAGLSRAAAGAAAAAAAAPPPPPPPGGPSTGAPPPLPPLSAAAACRALWRVRTAGRDGGPDRKSVV